MGTVPWNNVPSVAKGLKKHRDEILQLPLRLSAHIISRKLKILGTDPKFEEIISFFPDIFVHFVDFYSNYIEQNCHVWLRYFISLISLVNTYN